MAIATRPDCLPEDVLDLLAADQPQDLFVGGTGFADHARTNRPGNESAIRLGGFRKVGRRRLKARKIEVCAHIILGLPGESREEMLATAEQVAGVGINGLKIHLFHLMKDSELARGYEGSNIIFMEQDEYVRLLVDILEKLPPDVVIHRLTGDAPRDLLLGPRWSLNKWEVLNAIDREFKQRNSWQGKLWK